MAAVKCRVNASATPQRAVRAKGVDSLSATATFGRYNLLSLNLTTTVGLYPWIVPSTVLGDQI